MMLQQKTTVIDLNWLLSCSGILLPLFRRATSYEHRTNSVFANTRFHSKASIQNLCQSIQWQLQRQIVLVFRSISNNGICSTNLSPKLKRYRNLFASFAQKTLPLWLSWNNVSQQFIQCKREKRLANLPRLCTSTYRKSKTALCRRRLWRHLKKHRDRKSVV